MHMPPFDDAAGSIADGAGKYKSAGVAFGNYVFQLAQFFAS
jgi:hypothetical protein